jgi:hypothetical protein
MIISCQNRLIPETTFADIGGPIMPQVNKWRSKRPYIVKLRPDPSSTNQCILELPTGALLCALATLETNGDPVFSLPLDQLLAHIALPYKVNPTEMDFRLLPDGVLEIDLGNIVINPH